MNQSLDGYVDHTAFPVGPTLLRHSIGEARGTAGSVYGRRMYEMKISANGMQTNAFAAAWRDQPKWVVSRSLKSVGPNTMLVEGDLEGAIRGP